LIRDVGKYISEEDIPVDVTRSPFHFSEGAVAYAGMHLHVDGYPAHTHSFVEIVFAIGGSGTHDCLAGRQDLAYRDVILLRPGVWHSYQNCRRLELYNCCFSSELLHRELAWTREDPLLGFLLWNGPYTAPRRGALGFRLEQASFDKSVNYLDALNTLRQCSPDSYRADFLGLLSLLLGELGRGAAAALPGQASAGRKHPAVTRAMRLLEEDIARSWALAELAQELHLAPAYLVRLFKDATGLPPMAYLAQVRAEHAAVLLLHSDQPVMSIGRRVGWPDQNHFARRFKAHYGLSATSYRKRFAPGAAHLPEDAARAS